MNKEDIYAATYGGIVADALGVPYEFDTRREMLNNPATTMTGYGTYNQPVGTWSDDSSLTIALMDSLSNGGIDYDDIMKKFSDWLHLGEYSPAGKTFDVGRTTQIAILNYDDGKNPIDCGGKGGRNNGNGSLMRIMPILLYVYHKSLPLDEEIKLIDNISSLTHGHRISKASCNIYNFIVKEILDNRDESFKTIIENGINKSREYYEDMECFNKLYDENFLNKSIDDIGSTGYVVDSLEVGLYCCYNTTSYKEAVLTSINLGGDTDTNGLITGCIAALYYGYDSIPTEWIEATLNKELIDSILEKFCKSLGV